MLYTLGHSTLDTIAEAVEEACRSFPEKPELVLFFSDGERFSDFTEALHLRYPLSTVIGASTYASFSPDGMCRRGLNATALSDGIHVSAGLVREITRNPGMIYQDMLDIVRRREQVARKLLLFSTFPFLPAIAVAVRSFSGIDRFDYTPVVMGAAFVCLYLMVFRYNDTGIIPASMKEAVEQTSRPIWIYDPARKECSYENRSAREQYADAFGSLLPDIPQKRSFERGALQVSAMCGGSGRR